MMSTDNMTLFFWFNHFLEAKRQKLGTFLFGFWKNWRREKLLLRFSDLYYSDTEELHVRIIFINWKFYNQTQVNAPGICIFMQELNSKQFFKF